MSIARSAAVLAAVVAALGSACSLILDTDSLPQRPDGRPGEIDGGPPDAIPVDADPTNFSIDSADPGEVLEGAGAKGVPVVIRFYGMNIVDPTVTAAWSDGFADPITVIEYHASNTYDEVAVALRVPVRPDLNDGACNSVQIHFAFHQDGALMDDAVDVPLHCLDELIDIANFTPGELYSRIDLSGTAHHFTQGTPAPIVLQAVEDIRLDKALDVDALNLTAGAGSGCDGGAVGQAASCAGGGSAGMGDGLLTHGGGGSGGGYFTGGVQGADGGQPGSMHGNAMLVPIGMAGIDGNHGSGGGGGGTGGGGTAGAGGGGGGTIELIAGGEIIVSPGALVRAQGGRGGNGTGNAVTGSGGSGAGGSGGAILVRAGAGVRFAGGSFAWLTTPKGLPGTAASGGNSGGAGADGRTRVDQAVASPGVGGMVSVGGSTAGPAWDPTAPALVTSPAVMLRLRAQSGSYGVILNDLPITGDNVTITGTSFEFTVNGLHRGRNTICALYGPIGAANTDRDEARTCIDVFYVPTSQ